MKERGPVALSLLLTAASILRRGGENLDQFLMEDNKSFAQEILRF